MSPPTLIGGRGANAFFGINIMEFFKQNTKIEFMGIRKISGAISVVLSIVALIIIFTKGLNVGLEFTGGVQVELRFSQDIAPDSVRGKLANAGIRDARVQQYGSSRDILIRMATHDTVAVADAPAENRLVQTITQALADQTYNVEIRKVDFIGSEVGSELAEQGILAVLAAIVSTMVYIALRFEYRFAVGAAVGLCHDMVLLLGIFSLFQIEFDLATLAAILAVLGYSLNDTIVIFDRVRENFRHLRTESAAEVMNISINQTLSRTLMTSWMTLLVVLALLVYGGSSLFGFSLALTLGIIIGTYSSIYVAGACAIGLGLSRADLLKKPKTLVDDMP
jgi:preprotein translocase subunit SecF